MEVHALLGLLILASTWALRPMCALRRRHNKTRAAFAAARSTLASRASLSSLEMVAMAAVSSSVKTMRFPAPSAAVTASTTPWWTRDPIAQRLRGMPAHSAGLRTLANAMGLKRKSDGSGT